MNPADRTTRSHLNDPGQLVARPSSLRKRDAEPARSRVEVSVLVPSFNSGRYLNEAVQSALDQSGVRLEVIVQDGGSTDGSVEPLASIHDSRLRVVSEQDAGQSDALNRALRAASGEFVVWLNADDLLAPGALATLVARARQRDLDVVHGSYENVDAQGRPIKAYTSAPLETPRLIRHGTYIFSGAILIRREVLQQLGGFDARLHYCMDYDLLHRLARDSAAKGRVSQIVARFRRQPASKSESASLPFLKEWLVVSRRNGATGRDVARTTALFTAYVLLRPVWRSRLWLRLRPSKHLGGR